MLQNYADQKEIIRLVYLLESEGRRELSSLESDDKTLSKYKSSHHLFLPKDT